MKDLPQKTEINIKESIESSLGLLTSDKILRPKLLASEDARHRLQGQIFVLEQRLQEIVERLGKCRAEASLNAQGLKKCSEERERLASACGQLDHNCSRFENECFLYERNLERAMGSCDEFGRDNEELRARVEENFDLVALSAEIDFLKKDKENLRINLQRAEEEVKMLFKENKMLDDENKRLNELLK